MPLLLKRATVAGLSIVTVLGLASIASAAPYGVKDLKDKHSATLTSSLDAWLSITPASNANHAVIAIAKSVAANAKQNAQDEVVGIGLASLKIQSTNSVPVSGSTIVFLGAGLVGLALWRGWSRCSMA
jgi:hypothetical protein